MERGEAMTEQWYVRAATPEEAACLLGVLRGAAVAFFWDGAGRLFVKLPREAVPDEAREKGILPLSDS